MSNNKTQITKMQTMILKHLIRTGLEVLIRTFLGLACFLAGGTGKDSFLPKQNLPA